MCDLFRMEGKHCIAMSLDDFYLPGAQQEQLAKAHAQNSLLELRGNGKLYAGVVISTHPDCSQLFRIAVPNYACLQPAPTTCTWQ